MTQQNMRFYDQLSTTPNEARKTIKGGRLNGFTDINPMWRIKKLTQVFGPVGLGWKYEIVNQRLERGSGSEVAAFVDILLYYKDGDKWSAPIPGSGGSKFVTKEKSGEFTSDECFKMATTDAIGSACKLLGMSADIYFGQDQDRTKYSNPTGTQNDKSSGKQQEAANRTLDAAAAVVFREGPYCGQTLGEVWNKDTQYIRDIRKDSTTPADILAAIETINNSQKRR